MRQQKNILLNLKPINHNLNSINEIFHSLIGELSILDCLNYAAIFSLDKDFFIFDINKINDDSCLEKAIKDFDLLNDNGIISSILNLEKPKKFPELKDVSNSENFQIFPIVTNKVVENILILNFKEYWSQNSQENQLFIDINVNQFTTAIEVVQLNFSKVELELFVNEYKQNNIKDIFNESEVINTILDSIQTGVIIAEKDTGKIVKSNSIADRIITGNKTNLVNNYITSFLSFDNNLLNTHYESKITNSDGQNIDILRKNSFSTIDGIEYLFESFVEIIEQKKIQNLLKDHNEDLEKLVNKRTLDLQNSIKELESSIEQRKQAERNIENEKKYSELKTKFLLMVSHEFRTPLTIVRNNLEIIKNHKIKLSDEQYNFYINRILKSLDFISTILLNINKYQEDVANVTIDKGQLINVKELLENKITEFTQKNTKPTFIDINVPNDLVLEYSAQTFVPIFDNVIDNMFKFAKEIVISEIKYIGNETEHIYEFIDKGIGIPPQDIERVYDIFYRGSNIGNIEGVGMGLAVTSKILQFINGSISIESKVNVETKITIKIPNLLSKKSHKPN